MRNGASVRRGPRSVGSLCSTCRHAAIAFGEAEGQEFYHCNEFGKNITAKIVQCNCYYDKRVPLLEDMYQTAWYLVTSMSRSEIGFVSHEEFKALQRKGKVKDNPEIGTKV